MQGIILAAGRGVRLNGSAAELPKCLTAVGAETMLARNVRLLREAGVRDVTVVIGHGAAAVRQRCPGVAFVENARFAQTNSLYSLWLARPFLTNGFVVMNCDVVVHPQLLADLLSARHDDALLADYRGPGAPYTDEEMKVHVRRGCVVDISKTLPDDRADAENLGVARFGAEGARRLIDEMDALIRAGEHRAWAPLAFGAFAQRRALHVVGTRGLPWIEIDFPEDHRRAVEDVLPDIERDTAAEPRVAPAPPPLARPA